tara:strand:+ start:359 stop:559 length:201 start_codon:yes stop_codon:yes gene_type:complete
VINKQLQKGCADVVVCCLRFVCRMKKEERVKKEERKEKQKNKSINLQYYILPCKYRPLFISNINSK